MLSISLGSAGKGPTSYTIRLPFALSPNQALKLGDGGKFDLLERECEVSSEGHQYVLSVRGFDSEEAALNFLYKICAGLIWYGFKGSVGFKFTPNPTPIKLYPEQVEITEKFVLQRAAKKRGWSHIDGDYDPSHTVIVPEHKRLITFGVGPVSLHLDRPLSVLADGMNEGLMHGQPELILQNPKLRLACEVFLSSHFESSPAASFLTRITALEILIGDKKSSEPVIKLVKEFIDETKKVKKNEKDTSIQRELESLLGGLNRLRYRSIKRQIRDLVEETLQSEAGEELDPTAIADEVSRFYDMRSTLVHDGKAALEEIRNGNNRLNQIVPKVLKRLYCDTAQSG